MAVSVLPILIGIMLGVIPIINLILTVSIMNWLTSRAPTLSSSEFQAVLEALHQPRSTLTVEEVSVFCYIFAVMFPMSCHNNLNKLWYSLAALAWVASIVLNFFYLAKTSWTPLSALSHFSPRIPHTIMVSNKILALNVMVIVQECLVIPTSIFAIWLFWLKINQTPAHRPVRAPRPAVPQPPDPRNSQSGAPAEYDLESQPLRDAGSVDNHALPETAIDTNLIIPEAANSASQVKYGAE